MKILIVEDDLSHAKLAQLVLLHEGSTVRHAAGAAQALELIAADPPDAILLDLKLDGLDGLALARALKANPQTRHIAIVACTAYSDSYPEKHARAAGCDAFFIKPVDMRTLQDQMRVAVESMR